MASASRPSCQVLASRYSASASAASTRPPPATLATIACTDICVTACLALDIPAWSVSASTARPVAGLSKRRPYQAGAKRVDGPDHVGPRRRQSLVGGQRQVLRQPAQRGIV